MNQLTPIEHNDQRVLLTSQLAESYDTDSKVISYNFNSNKDRYQEGKHYFVLQGDLLKAFREIHDLPPNLNKVYLWTEKGALLHAKSLNTDKAWEVYDQLVETYFKARELQTNLSELSPELRLLINLEMRQKEQDRAIEEVNKRVDDIKDVVALNPQSWREEARKLIVRIAQAMGGNEYIRDVQAEIFGLVDERAGVSLATRLTNKRRRMADEGICKSKRDKLNKVDVIADDKKLIEIYLAVVKEMAVQRGAKIA